MVLFVPGREDVVKAFRVALAVCGACGVGLGDGLRHGRNDDVLWESREQFNATFVEVGRGWVNMTIKGV